MDELVTAIGNSNSVLFELEWDKATPSGTAAVATRGSLRVVLASFPVWFGHETATGFHWTWVELLEFLAHAWPHLVLEDGLPFGVGVSTAPTVTAEIELALQQLPLTDRDEAESQFEAFLEVHDVARGIQGAVLPSLLIVRLGLQGLVASNDRYTSVSFSELIDTLKRLGNLIADRLRATEDHRALAAVSAWQARDDVTPRQRVAISTGLTGAMLDGLEQGRSIADAWELNGFPSARNELLAAARLSSGLDLQEVAKIVDVLRNLPQRASPEVDRLSDQARAVLESVETEAPFEEGQLLAYWLRSELGIGLEARVDPAALLKKWEVYVDTVDLVARSVDGVACWGSRHGPAVVVNSVGIHSKGTAGRRSTLAHEICHLLIDRSGALPAAEVLGGRVSRTIEARARAFAAELLLPRKVAGDVLASNAELPSRALKTLIDRYGVSAEVVAWQARNSDIALPHEVMSFLRQNVSRPQYF